MQIPRIGWLKNQLLGADRCGGGARPVAGGDEGGVNPLIRSFKRLDLKGRRIVVAGRYRRTPWILDRWGRID